ncbi:MAG TPA: ornithine cyclodeaminase family protein [Candidatus Acidoferrum sp.]|nr:ornithine cyclodeaminase family protein [Candidatus Acidoferrum sp.]
MRYISADELNVKLEFPPLVEALRDLFRRGVDEARAIHLSQPLAEGRRNDWLVLPAWQFDRHMGVKLVSVFAHNEAKGLASVQGLYVLFDGSNGLPLAVIDGAAITLWKTAANSALAASYLARQDARRLLMVGAGALAPYLARAHCAVRPIAQLMIWNRTVSKAERMAATLARPGLSVEVVNDLAAAVARADIVSCATMASTPIVKGAWLAPGVHLDLVGAYRPETREADDEAIRRARVFIDAWFTAGEHCGDICQPVAAGLLRKDDITDTFQLARGERPGRLRDDEITLFKSGGGGHEDLGTAQHILRVFGPDQRA